MKAVAVVKFNRSAKISHASIPVKTGEDQELTLTASDYSLLTDLYELTMAACYVGKHIEGRSCYFRLFR